MKEYPYRIHLKDMKIIDSEHVQTLKNLVDMTPKGIAYPGGDVVIFSANNIHDIAVISKLGYWDHSCQPKRVKEGWIGYVIPNEEIRKEHNNVVFGIQFTVSADVREITKAEKQTQTWPSIALSAVKDLKAEMLSLIS